MAEKVWGVAVGETRSRGCLYVWAGISQGIVTSGNDGRTFHPQALSTADALPSHGDAALLLPAERPRGH